MGHFKKITRSLEMLEIQKGIQGLRKYLSRKIRNLQIRKKVTVLRNKKEIRKALKFQAK